MKTIYTNTVAETIDAGKIVQLTEKDRKDQGLIERTLMVKKWIERNLDFLTPGSVFEEDLYLNYLYYLLGNSLDQYINNTKVFFPDQNYQQQVKRLLQVVNVGNSERVDYFTDTFLKTVLDESIYNNFSAYKKLYAIDEKINNCSPFNPQQDYNQEYNRQTEFQGLDIVDTDETFTAFYNTVESALQQIFCRLKSDLKLNSTITFSESTKLW